MCSTTSIGKVSSIEVSNIVEISKNTLWSLQCDVRHSVEKLHELLICSRPQEAAKPMESCHIEDMITYETETLKVLEIIIGQARRLGKE